MPDVPVLALESSYQFLRPFLRPVSLQDFSQVAEGEPELPGWGAIICSRWEKGATSCSGVGLEKHPRIWLKRFGYYQVLSGTGCHFSWTSEISLCLWKLCDYESFNHPIWCWDYLDPHSWCLKAWAMDDSESDVPADYVRLGDEGNLGRAMPHQQNSQRSWNF